MTITTMKDIGKSNYVRSCLYGNRKGRIKRILMRLQRRKSIYAAFKKYLLSTPIPEYINNFMVANPKAFIGPVMTMKRYRND